MAPVRTVDVLLSVVLPGTLAVFAVLSHMGFSDADFGDSYVMESLLLCAAVTAVCPVLRLVGLVRLPYWFIGAVSVAVYMHGVSLYYGTYRDLWWWDHLTHFTSSVVVTSVVFTSLCALVRYVPGQRLGGNAAFLLLVAAVSFGMGDLWEVAEWTVDAVSGNHYMQYSVFDTMEDVAMDVLGVSVATAVLVAVLGHGPPSDVAAGLVPRLEHGGTDRRRPPHHL